MTDLVGHFLLFTAVIVGALAFPLLLGRLIRPDNPNPEKNAVYECGEPTIGSSQVQFDLRFYVVALLFVIFDVEAVFIFPWAIRLEQLAVFGLVEMGIFIVILALGLLYAWRKGVLRWV